MPSDVFNLAACGLYYLAELIEEYTNTTKKFLWYIIRAELLLHTLLLFDRQPLSCLLLGAAAQIGYIRFMQRFPFISFLGSSEGLVAGGLFLANNIMWVRHFWGSRFTIEYILAFFLATTWLVPITLFLGMAGDQSVLPGAGGYPYSTGPSHGHQHGDGDSKQRRGMMLRLFDILRRKRNAVLPEVMSRFPPSSGLHPKEKI
jgi:hypothetical protein